MNVSNRNAARRRVILKSAIGLGLASTGLAAFAQAKKYGPGASDTQIVIGNTAPYSGPASAYGAIGKIYAAHFQMVNDQGGINGRKIKFISLDDAFSPPKTVEQVRRLVEKEEVLFMGGMVGSSTTLAAQRYLEERKIPNIFITSGATRWGDYKNNPFTIGFNFNYTTEGNAYAEYLLKEKPGAKIAVIYQNDEFGKDTFAGVKSGLGYKAKDMIVAERSYELTDPTVDSQVIALQASGADTLINLSTPKFAAMVIRKVSQLGWRPLHLLTSNASSIETVLSPAGLDKSIGTITVSSNKDTSEWVKDPAYPEWQAFMKKYYPDGSADDAINIASRSIAQTIVQVLKQCGDDLTRENVMRQATNLKNLTLPALLPGVMVNTSPTDYRPVEEVRLRRFDGTQWVVFGELLGTH